MTLEVAIRSLRLGGVEVLGEIAFSLAPGERAALFGPSGVGKSTLLSAIAGLNADFDGRVTAPEPVAMAFQAPRLLPWRTLERNLTIAAPWATPAEARAALAEVGLEDAADRHPEKTSLGMQRRAALARALLVRPKLLLMDEPLVSLDEASARAMRGLILRTLDLTGATALIATHDRREALALADRALALGGRPARVVADRRSPLDRDARRDPGQVETALAAWDFAA